MKFCLPIESDNGFKSPVAEHFGTAPLFVIIDTETRKHTVVPNADIGHAEGGCDPFRAIGGEQIDIIITGSLGGGALQKLNTAGIVVYKAEGATVMENLNLLADSCLHEFVLAEGASAGQGSCCPH
jgi:predicted Fe-Mo cluster-binding NifX family protein